MGAVAIALALAGCGGGGGAESAPAAVSSPPQREVLGTAAKGLIKGGKVSVYAIDALGVRANAALATAITGADGTYKLQVPASLHNFVIEVSTAPGAVMADEATGMDIPIPDAMKLRNVVTLADNASGAYQGSVSPLTEMVARTAESNDGKLLPRAVAKAKTDVRALLGFDPETVKPVNSNSAAAADASEDEKNQSLALAAISQMATTASADCPQGDPGERIACVVKAMAASVSTRDGQPTLDQARANQFRDAIGRVAKDKTINRTGKEQVVGLPVLAPAPAPIPAPTAPASGTPTQVESTRALFASLRTNLRAIGEGDAFRTTAGAIKADLTGTAVPLGNDVGGLASLAVSAIDNLDRIRAGDSFSTKVPVSNNQVRATPLTGFSTIANGEGSCEIIQSPLSMSCTVVVNDYLPGTSANFMAGTRVYVTRTLKLTPKEGSTTGYSYTAFLEKNVLNYEGMTPVGSPTREPIGGSFSGEMTFARTATTLMQLAVKGRMPGRLNSSGAQRSDFEEWSLDVARSEEANNIALYKFGGEFTAIVGSTPTQAGQAAGKLEIDPASFLRVALEGANNKLAPSAANELQVTLRGTVGGTTMSGTVRASDGKQDKSNTTHLPTRMSFDGYLKHQDGTVFSGKVAVTRNGFENFDAMAVESANNFVADTVEISGALSAPGRPTLSLTLGATRTGQDAADITAQYRDGTSVVNASVTSKVGERKPLVKVSSADGVSFSFTDRSVPVKVTKDGAVVAELNPTTGIITYNDGTTESLK